MFRCSEVISENFEYSDKFDMFRCSEVISENFEYSDKFDMFRCSEVISENFEYSDKFDMFRCSEVISEMGMLLSTWSWLARIVLSSWLHAVTGLLGAPQLENSILHKNLGGLNV